MITEPGSMTRRLGDGGEWIRWRRNPGDGLLIIIA